LNIIGTIFVVNELTLPKYIIMKTIIIAILSLLLICTSSFTRKEVKPHFVGELYGGGIVFFVEKNGKHGLIASLYDVGTETRLMSSGYKASSSPQPPPFQKKNNEINEPSSTTFKFRTNEWDGFKNTEMMINAGFDPSAASICKKHNSGNYSGWYLPAIDELGKLITSKETVNSILDNDTDPKTQGLSGSYWSSTFTQGSYSSVWVYQNEIKSVNFSNNYIPINIRAIRKF